ncbi:MAG: cation diffusion facilitator family transporter [Deltaproteobacteria bacterium]
MNRDVFFYTDKDRYAFYGFAIGAVMFFPFLYISIMADSMTLIAMSIRSAAETLSLLITWMGLRKVARKEIYVFNYGGGKIENLSSLAIALSLVLSFVELFFRSIDRFYHPVHVSDLFTFIGILIVVAFFLIALWLLIKSYYANHRDPSPAGDAQWRLYLAKTVIHLSVVISLGASLLLKEYTWSLYIDPTVSLLLSFYILGAAYLIGKRSIDELLDKTIDEPLQMMILGELAAYFDEYLEVHGIRSRRTGQFVFIEIFLEFESNKLMGDVQTVINRIKSDLEKKIDGSQVMIVPSTSSISR